MAPPIVNRRRDAEIIARYQKGGATLRALGVLYGISDNRVRQVLVRAGVQLCGRGKYIRRTTGGGMTIKPIETRYKGYRFRSRLEARWAVFFDTMGLRWEYEPEGYVGAGGLCYLPDFRVDGNLIVEIKPSLDESDPGLVERLRGDREQWGAFLATTPDTTMLVMFGPPGSFDGVPRGIRTFADHTLERIQLGECRRCGALGWLTHDEHGIVDGASLRCGPSCQSERLPLVGEKITAAVNAARSARFEHGEKGAR